MELQTNRNIISKAIGKTYDQPEISMDEFKQDTDEDRQLIAWCRNIISERDDFSYETYQMLKQGDLVNLKENAPLIYQHLVDEADNEDYELEAYVAFLNQDNEGLYNWTFELYKWVSSEVKDSERKALVQAIGEKVKAKLTAPIGNDLLARYQASIDNEMYKAIEALRKQQEWRSKVMVKLEVEVA
jgi:succinate dehydrogenase flavin-adding protein (antitoxin of CptAB toxin-antitoxin module)